MDTAISDEDRKFLRERLVREARAAGRLAHPGIVTIFAIGEDAGQTFIAMEHVDGVSFHNVLSSRAPAGWNRIISVIEQAAAALDYAHAKGWHETNVERLPPIETKALPAMRSSGGLRGRDQAAGTAAFIRGMLRFLKR